MKHLLIGISLFFSLLLSAQNIVVKDAGTREPIPNVTVFTPSRSLSGLTDPNGIVHFDKLSTKDSLIFSHTSYRRKIFSYKDIEKSAFVVFLQEKNNNLDEFIISANRWEQKENEVPIHISLIKSQEAAFFQPQTSADLLNYSNEIFVQKSQQGGGSPMIRGFAANRILLVIDGVRMNNLIFRSGNLQNSILIDPNSVEEAEILFGPGSVIYGSDALGGVLDFHTRKLSLATDTSRFKASGLFRFSSAAKEQSKHIDITFEHQKWASFTSFSHSSFGDLRMGKTGDPRMLRKTYVQRIGNRDSIIVNDDPLLQRFSGYDQWNVLQKFKLRLNSLWDIQYAFHYTTSSNIPRYDKLFETKNTLPKYADWHYGPQNWMMNRLQINGKPGTPLVDMMKIIFAQQKVQESRIKRKYNKDDEKHFIEDVNIYSLNLDAEKFLSKNSILTYGLEAIYNGGHSTAYALNLRDGSRKRIGSRYPNGKNYSQSMGGFLHWKRNINPLLSFQSGLRYEVYHLYAGFSDRSVYELDSLPESISLNNRALSGSIGIVYRFHPAWRASANFSNGYRSPNLDDIAKIFDAEPGTMVVANPGLKAEDAYNGDGSLTWSGGDKWKVKITAFYSYLVNIMVRGDFQWNGQDSLYVNDEWLKIRAVVNAGKGNIYGISGQVKYRFTDGLSTQVFYTWMRGKDGMGNAIRHVSPPFGSFYLNYEKNQWRASAYAIFNGKIAYENLAPTERKKVQRYALDTQNRPYAPAWYTLNFKIRYRYNSNFSLNAGIENILDKAYRPYSSGILAPGRNFLFSLNVRI